MSSAYFAPLVVLPIRVVVPGTYRTRAGEEVVVERIDTIATPGGPVLRRDFAVHGRYADGTPERWHISGRVHAHAECRNDIVLTVRTARRALSGPRVAPGEMLSEDEAWRCGVQPDPRARALIRDYLLAETKGWLPEVF